MQIFLFHTDIIWLLHILVIIRAQFQQIRVSSRKKQVLLAYSIWNSCLHHFILLFLCRNVNQNDLN